MNSLSGRFFRSIVLLHRGLKSEAVKRMDSEITGAQLFLLHAIADRQKCKLTDLAELLDVKPSAVTVMIDRMVKCGYVIRVRDSQDRRVIMAELTDNGYAALTAARNIQLEITEHYLDILEPEERETVTNLLERLAAAYHKPGEAPNNVNSTK
ncbi:MarR family winged helix-turn-helix transcriptional regulator [Paenibacillus sp. CAU 1782]